MKTPNLKVWTDGLRTTDAPQVTGKLTRIVDEQGTIGHCCLGLGCVIAGLTPLPLDEPESLDLGDDETNYLCYEDTVGRDARVVRVDGVPGGSFHRWLGTMPENAIATFSETSVDIDWPDGPNYMDHEGEEYRFSADQLNDDLGLTFSQIADVLDYFGIRGLASYQYQVDD